MDGVWMEQIFLRILNMSLVGSYCILAVLMVRLLLKRQPKLFSYVLWSLVWFRLVCPVSFTSPFSIFQITDHVIPDSQKIQEFTEIKELDTETEHTNEAVPANAEKNTKTDITTRYTGSQSEKTKGQADRTIPKKDEESTQNTRPASMPYFWFVIFGIWMAGLLGLLGYSVISSCYLRKKLRVSEHKNGYAIVPQLETPLVFGIIHPRIYLPDGLSPQEIPYILEHERVHIRRRDYLIKPLAFLVLCIHWFNPLVWLAFFCMSKDMEMSCDEAVLKKMGREIKQDYSTSLLSLACGRNYFNGGPLTFGEQGVKERIKNVLRYKKPHIWGIILAIFAIVVSFLVLLSNPAAAGQKKENSKVETQVVSTQPPASPKPVQTARPVSKLVSSEAPESAMPEMHFPDIENLTFSDLEGMVFWYGSGAGAWCTKLSIKADGSFSGYYEDHDADAAYLYPGGTSRICSFKGQFSELKKTSPYEYRMQCTAIEAEGTPGEEEIRNDIRYITSEPYGFEHAGEVILYLPGKLRSEIPLPLMLKGLQSENDEQGVNNYYVLYNAGDHSLFEEELSAEGSDLTPPSTEPAATLSPAEIAGLQKSIKEREANFTDFGGREVTCKMYEDTTLSLLINKDGSFRGTTVHYIGEEDGRKVYEESVCRGRFSELTKIAPYEYSMNCVEVEMEGTPGEIREEPWGKVITKELDYFNNMDEIRVYLPGKRKMDLPEHFYKYYIFEREAVSDDGVIAEYLFYNMQKDAGFLYYSN